MRASLLTNPAGALATARRLRAQVAREQNSTVRAINLAKLERIEGTALHRLGRPDEALPLIRRALGRTARVAPGDPLRGDLLLSLGSIRSEQGKVAEALSAMQAAFKVFTAAGQPRGAVKALLYIAALYDDGKDYAAAVKYLRQARDVRLHDDDLSLSLNNNLAGALKELGRYAEAERAYQVALALARTKGALPRAQVLSGLARTALLRGDTAAAGRHIDAGLALAGSGEARVLRPMLLTVRAQVDLRLGRPLAALAALRPVFEAADFDSAALKSREAHEAAWHAYRASGQPTLALEHLESLKRLDDEATKLATSASTGLMAARFDFANQELRIATLKAQELRRKVAAEREQARIERLIFAGAAAVTLIVLAMLGFGIVTIGRSRNAVRAANDDLAQTNEELGRALAARTEFLATTSHEIRTPLNGILGMSQVLLADPSISEATRDRVGVVHAAGNTMRALVDDILDVAKIESGRLTVDSEPFDLSAVVEEAVRLWEPTIRAKGVAFSHRSDVPAIRVSGDAARVRQVLFNLLSNAAKFTDAGCVLLSAEWRDGRARLSVADTGIGIPAAKLEEVFESFRQADAGTTRRFGGTGLGLSICRQLARAMHGDVTVTSREGEGSRFVLELPLPEADPAGEAAAAIDAPAGLLIVDANPISRAMLRTLLESAGATVTVAAALPERMAAADLLLDAGVLGRDQIIDRLERLCADVGRVTLLWPADEPAPGLPPGVQLIRKPVSGPELVRRLLPCAPVIGSVATDVDTALVSRAA